MTDVRNPALELYAYWRAIAEYKMQKTLDDARNPNRIFRHSERIDHVLDRHCGLSVSGVDTNGEPIIQMGHSQRYEAHIGSTLHELFTLFPDGSFKIDNYSGFRAIHKHTFIHWTWAMRDRAFVVVDHEDGHRNGEIYRWASLDTRDYTAHRLYIPFYVGSRRGRNLRAVFPGDERLNLVQSTHGWFITSPDSHQQKLLDEGYGVGARRYKRYERAAELAANPSLSKRITGEITTGRLTPTETVAHMTGLLKVYDPRP